MARMTDPDRLALGNDLMHQVPPGVNMTVNKVVFRQLVNACDQVLDDNAGALNSAVQAVNSSWNTLPVPMRAFIFAHTILRRFVKGV